MDEIAKFRLLMKTYGCTGYLMLLTMQWAKKTAVVYQMKTACAHPSNCLYMQK